MFVSCTVLGPMSVLPATPAEPADVPAEELAELRRRLRAYQERYGALKPEGLERLERAEARRATELRHLRRRIEEMEAEAAALEQEAAGYRKGIFLLLSDAIRGIGERHREGWSPEPVLGYRMWAVRAGGFFGVASRWERARMTARCLDGMGDMDLPHSDGRCGRLGCGVYASKRLEFLLVERPSVGDGALAVGVVAMTGKVVEHERGYRAAEAEVVALAVVGLGAEILTDDQLLIDSLFTHPDAHLDLTTPPRRPSQQEMVQVRAFLDLERRRKTQWM